MKPAQSPADLALVKIVIFFQIRLDGIWMAVVEIIYFLLELIGSTKSASSSTEESGTAD